MVDAHDVDGMFQVCDGIEDTGFAVFAEETRIECGVCHTAFGCQRPHLVVGEVARMVTERPTAGMTAYNRFRADVQCIIE